MHVTVSHNTLRDWETRVSAVDLDGMVYVSPRHHTSVGELASTAGHFERLRPGRVSEFRFEVRPYKWFDFRNVALEPRVAQEHGVGTDAPSAHIEIRDTASD